MVKSAFWPQNGEEEEEDDASAASLVSRMVDIFIAGLSMTFAWCVLFASRWLYESVKTFEENECGIETVLGRILLALMLSIFCMAVIFLLDVIDDLMKGDSSSGAEIIDQIVDAKSVLAGFSWEHAFDGGVEAVAAKTSSPLIAASLLAGFVFVVIVPAWKRHILRKAMVLQDYKEMQVKAEMHATSDLITDP